MPPKGHSIFLLDLLAQLSVHRRSGDLSRWTREPNDLPGGPKQLGSVVVGQHRVSILTDSGARPHSVCNLTPPCLPCSENTVRGWRDTEKSRSVGETLLLKEKRLSFCLVM